MVLLFVVGVAAVIVVILIAVFLSVRLGRGEDHDEPMGRSSDREHDRPDAEDPGWRDERAPRRSPAGAGRSARSGQRSRPQAQDRRHRDGDGHRPERGQATEPGDYDYPQRRPGRYDSGPMEQPADDRRPVTAGSRRPGSGRDPDGRRAGTGRGRPEKAPALYDTGPARRPAADDFPSEPLHATDFPSGEFPSRPQPAEYPSGEFPSASRSAADAPTARYRTADPHTDEFASGPLPEEDFASSEFPAADYPSEEMPAAPARTRPAPPKTDPGRDRSDSHRRPAKGQNAPKGRSRKRDDDDWPSMEWDKLTDEQYWAQLSSDKPLATTARSPQPAREPRPAAGEARPAASRNGHARPAGGGPKPAPAAPPARSRDLADRKPASPQREAAAGRPVESRREETVPRREREREATSRREPEREMVSRRGTERETASRREEAVSRREPDRETVSGRGTAPQREAVTELLPVRPRQQAAATAAPRNDTPAPLRPDATPTPPVGQPSLAMLTSLASGPNGALDDDPLTSPSFSRPTADSRSYRRSGAQAGASGAAARADDPAAAAGYGSGAHAMAGYGGNGHPGNGHTSNGYTSNGHPGNGYTNGDAPANGGRPGRAQVNGAYQVPDYADRHYADPGYAYAPAAPAASPAAATQSAGWHSAPTHAPAQGNPYGSYVESAPAASYPSIPPAGYQDRQTGAGLPAYPGDHRGYQEPAYDSAATVRYPGPGGHGAAGPPAASGPPVHPAGVGGFPQSGGYPEAGYAEDGGYGNGYPSQAPYADSYGGATAEYVPSYPADGYPAEQYGHDGYGGYPADQG
jgi:hypothetical protein